MTLYGIDISKWQTDTPSLAGKDFVFVRASVGGQYDGSYSKHSANVKAAGKVLGAYHFGTGYDTRQQARLFLSVTSNTNLLGLDLERNATGPSMTDEQAVDFINIVHDAGMRIGLYHSRSGFPNLGQDWNWVAAWGSTPPNMPYAFWQYRGSPLDLDTYNGTLADLHRLAGLPVTYTIRVKPACFFLFYAIVGGRAVVTGRQLTATGWHSTAVPVKAILGGVTTTLYRIMDGKWTGKYVHPGGYSVSVSND